MTLLTVGHGRLDRVALGRLLAGAGVEQVVDVRRFPGSRANADARDSEMQAWLQEQGIAYRWEPRLGGRRRLDRNAAADSPDRWWRVAAFRAYAGHTRTSEFGAAIADLVEEVARRRVAIMCSESVWWRCHRRLVADVLVLRSGVPVAHLMHDGRLHAHPPSDGARRRPDGTLVWDGPRDG